MDVILFGGSFNPPHIGHRHVITTIQTEFPKAKIYVCPNFVSPFKQKERKFTKEEIWNLCLTEFEALLSPKVILWDEEIKQNQISYTIDTLHTLQKKEPNQSLSLVIGEDNLMSFQEWKSYEEILTLIHSLVVVRRFTKPPDTIPCPSFIPKTKLFVLNNALVPMSSTHLRNQTPEEWETFSLLPNTRSLLLSYREKESGMKS